MLDSQRHSLRLSEIRSRLNELNGVDELTDENRAELRTLTGEYADVETRYRAAVIAEDDHELRGSRDGVDPETRATFQLLRESRVARFLAAADRGSVVDGREGELLEALSIPNEVGAFPLRLLDRRLDEVESRADVATNLGTMDDQTTLTTRPWISRVFLEDGAADFLGVERPSVGSGDVRYVAVTGGTTAATTARGGSQDAAALAISTIEVVPRRMSAGYLFYREDVARHGAQLESSLRSDLRMVLSEQIDKGLLNGETGQYTGLRESGAGKVIDTQVNLKAVNAANPTRAELLTALAGMLDGRYATMPGHLKLLISRTVYNRILIALASTSTDNMTILEVVQRMGFMIRVSDHFPASTAANTVIGIASRGRGLSGSLVMPVWESMSMISDPYSGAAEGQVRLTLSLMFGRPTAVRADNWRQVKAVA